MPLALALHYMDAHRALPVFKGGELLRTGGRQGGIARDDFFHQPAVGFQPERQRGNVQQQPVVFTLVAGQHVGLHRRAEGDHLVGVEIVQRFAAEKFGNGSLNLRHAGGAADHNHAVHILLAHAGVFKRLFYRFDGCRHQIAGERFKGVAADCGVDALPVQIGFNAAFRLPAQFFFGAAGQRQQALAHAGIGGIDAGGFGQMGGQAVVEIVAAQRRIAVGGFHFKQPFGQAQHRYVEGTAAQVVHHKSAFGGVVQPVGDGGSGGFVQQAQHVQTRQPRRVFGGLALGFVEIGRHGNHRAGQAAAQRSFRPLFEHAQNLGGNFNRGFHAVAGVQPDQALAVGKAVGQTAGINVFKLAPDQALGRADGIGGIAAGRRRGIAADQYLARFAVTHHRWQRHLPVFIGQTNRAAAAHSGDQAVGGSQIDAYRQPVLVRRGGKTGFGDLKQCHVCAFAVSEWKRRAFYHCRVFLSGMARQPEKSGSLKTG